MRGHFFEGHMERLSDKRNVISTFLVIVRNLPQNVRKIVKCKILLHQNYLHPTHPPTFLSQFFLFSTFYCRPIIALQNAHRPTSYGLLVLDGHRVEDWSDFYRNFLSFDCKNF